MYKTPVTNTEVAPAKLTVKEFRLDGRSVPGSVRDDLEENKKPIPGFIG